MTEIEAPHTVYRCYTCFHDEDVLATPLTTNPEKHCRKCHFRAWVAL